MPKITEKIDYINRCRSCDGLNIGEFEGFNTCFDCGREYAPVFV